VGTLKRSQRRNKKYAKPRPRLNAATTPTAAPTFAPAEKPDVFAATLGMVAGVAALLIREVVLEMGMLEGWGLVLAVEEDVALNVKLEEVVVEETHGSTR